MKTFCKTLLLLIYISAFIFHHSFSQQAPAIEWQNTIGGSSLDELYSIQQTIDGGFILGGISFSGISGDKTESSFGFGDWWIIKLDSSGNILWQNTIGGSEGDEFCTTEPTVDGGYIIGGTSGSNISVIKQKIQLVLQEVQTTGSGIYVLRLCIPSGKINDGAAIASSKLIIE